MEEAVVSNELPAEDRAPEDRAIGRPCGRGRVLHFAVPRTTKRYGLDSNRVSTSNQIVQIKGDGVRDRQDIF